MSQTATETPAKEWLEQRIQQLESAVASLRDTQVALQERVLQQQSETVNTPAHQPEIAPEPAPVMELADPPAAQPIAAPAAQPVAQTFETALKVAAVAIPVGSKLEGLPWLLVDTGREFLAVFRMFFDLHYNVAWSTRLLTLVLLPAIILSYWWVPFSSIPFAGGILVKLVDLVLMFIMFKALHREACRYMATRKPR